MFSIETITMSSKNIALAALGARAVIFKNYNDPYIVYSNILFFMILHHIRKLHVQIIVLHFHHKNHF